MPRMRHLAFIPLNAQFGGVRSKDPRKLWDSCAKAPPNADEIDDLITRCAAEALRLHGGIRPIEAERRRLYELAAELRVRREQANR